MTCRHASATGSHATAALLRMLVCAVLAWACSAADAGGAERFDVVLAGGYVMDPESGFEGVRDLGIRAGKIAALSTGPLDGIDTVDVTGLTVAPGFIDLHAHGQNVTSQELQLRDGVTTALDLEAGAFPVSTFYEQRSGRALINYGVAAGHVPARIRLKHGIDIVHPLVSPEEAVGVRALLTSIVREVWSPTGYAHEPLDAAEIDTLAGLVRQGLDAGGIGVGIALDYTPAASEAEVRRLFELAAERSVPCFVHLRSPTGPDDTGPIASVLAHAEATGASLHVVHIASSGLGQTENYLRLIGEARARGADVTTEVYPYTAASTMIESAMFDEGWQGRLGVGYEALQWPATGERLTEASFAKYRDEGGAVIVHTMTDAVVDRAIADPSVMIASDGMPFFEEREAHPRGAGTFSRLLGVYVRERGLLTPMQALRKITLLPARRLEMFTPQMQSKGRLRVGTDADITVFDAERISDRATYENSRQPSEGVRHVLIGGRFVVRDSQVLPSRLLGQAIRTRFPAPPATPATASAQASGR